jgi:hypothetical protein
MANNIPSGGSIEILHSIDSPNQRFRLLLQDDGNLVLYHKDIPLWSTNTQGKAVVHAIMQHDGNFVLYGPDGALWSSGSLGHPGAELVVHNDGTVKIRNKAGKWVWSSGGLIV